jgi:hypothetical protein
MCKCLRINNCKIFELTLSKNLNSCICYAEVMQRITLFFRRHFGPSKWAALSISLALTVVIVWLFAKTNNLEELGYGGGFLAMLLSSATVVLPAPGLAVVVALGAAGLNPLLFSTAAGLGATLGVVTGYLVGYGGYKIVEEQKHYRAIEHFVRKYGF